MEENSQLQYKEDKIGCLVEHAYILSQQILELQLPENLSLATKEQSEKSLIVINDLKNKINAYKKIATILNAELRVESCTDVEHEFSDIDAYYQ